jgi:hypothetical protein
MCHLQPVPPTCHLSPGACPLPILQLFFTHLAPILALGIGSTAIAFVLISAVLYAGFAGFRILKLQVGKSMCMWVQGSSRTLVVCELVYVR